jgi:hypothetical protein
MADHNCVVNPQKDCLPPGHPDVPHAAETTAARHELAAAINARVDAFRALHPNSAGCTHPNNATEKTTWQARIDAINVAETMMRGGTRIVAAEHVPAERYSVGYRQNGKDHLKVSDHRASSNSPTV